MRRLVRAAALLCVAAAFVAACDGSGGRPADPTSTVSSPPYSAKPNIVFVLTDDLSTDLVKFMPHVIGLQQSGMTFSNYTVTDSYCCPSRASILSGRFPHNTRVFTNGAPTGGFALFHERSEEKRTLPRRCTASGTAPR